MDIKNLTLQEKCSLLSGMESWYTTAIKEKDSPKVIAGQYKTAEAEEILQIEKDPKAIERLQEIREKRFAWLCKVAGFSDDKKLTETEVAVLEQLISSTEIEMNRVAENYAKKRSKIAKKMGLGRK